MQPPEESHIDPKGLRKQLGESLGGRFQNFRMAMLSVNPSDQNFLARVNLSKI
jgi:hypothetical protein